MKRPPLYILVAFAVAIGAAWYFYANSIPGYWAVNQAESSITYTSVKNGDIEEENTITGLSGQADFSGAFLFVIDLSSVETNIDIRNQRMKEFLFEVETYPYATLAGNFDLSRFEDLGVGESAEATIKAALNLHGIEKEITVAVLVKREDWLQVRITARQPVVIDAADFNLSAGLQKLIEIAGLENINEIVSFYFEIVLDGGVAPTS